MGVERVRDRISFSVAGGVADVRLDRPEAYNALDQAMFDALGETAQLLGDVPSLRAVVLSGEGRGFCAGLDMASFATLASGGNGGGDGDGGSPAPAGLDTGQLTSEEAAASSASDDGWRVGGAQRASWAWATLPVPVIAAIHGAALGGGMQVALGADIRVVSPDAKLGLLEVKWGLVPDMTATQVLPRLVGLDVAMLLVLTADPVSGEEALRMGLATVLAEDPLARAHEIAARIACHSPDAVRQAKALLRGAWRDPLQVGFDRERAVIRELIGSANQAEAVAAGLEGRAPRWSEPV